MSTLTNEKIKWQVKFRNEVYDETEAFDFLEDGSEPDDIRKERTMMFRELQEMHPDLGTGDVSFHLVKA